MTNRFRVISLLLISILTLTACSSLKIDKIQKETEQNGIPYGEALCDLLLKPMDEVVATMKWEGCLSDIHEGTIFEVTTSPISYQSKEFTLTLSFCDMPASEEEAPLYRGVELPYDETDELYLKKAEYKAVFQGEDASEQAVKVGKQAAKEFIALYSQPMDPTRYHSFLSEFSDAENSTETTESPDEGNEAAIQELEERGKLYDLWDLTEEDAPAGIYTRLVLIVDREYSLDGSEITGYSVTILYCFTLMEDYYS